MGYILKDTEAWGGRKRVCERENGGMPEKKKKKRKVKMLAIFHNDHNLHRFVF